MGPLSLLLPSAHIYTYPLLKFHSVGTVGLKGVQWERQTLQVDVQGCVRSLRSSLGFRHLEGPFSGPGWLAWLPYCLEVKFKLPFSGWGRGSPQH